MLPYAPRLLRRACLRGLRLRGGFGRRGRARGAVVRGELRPRRPRACARGLRRRRSLTTIVTCDMRLRLKCGAALRARIEALGEAAARTAVDGDPRDVEIVAVHVVVVLGVGDGAAHAASRSARPRTRRRTAAARALRARSCRESHRRRGAACAAPCARSAGARRLRYAARLAYVALMHFTAALSPPCPRKMPRRRELAELVPDHVLGDDRPGCAPCRCARRSCDRPSPARSSRRGSRS